MDARTSRQQKRISQRQEQQVADALDGRTQPASGATRLGGGSDVRSEEHAVECKYTNKKQYSLKQADLLKIRKTALQRGLLRPVMAIDFPNAVNPHGLPDRYVVIPWNDYIALLEEQKS